MKLINVSAFSTMNIVDNPIDSTTH